MPPKGTQKLAAFEAMRKEYFESKEWAKKEKLATKAINGESLDYAFWKMAKAIIDARKDVALEDKMEIVRDSWRSFLVQAFR